MRLVGTPVNMLQHPANVAAPGIALTIDTAQPVSTMKKEDELGSGTTSSATPYTATTSSSQGKSVVFEDETARQERQRRPGPLPLNPQVERWFQRHEQKGEEASKEEEGKGCR